MTITLSPELASLVERLVAGGAYLSPADVVREALQGLEHQQLSPVHRPGMLEILREMPPPGAFGSAAEADAFLREERGAWDK